MEREIRIGKLESELEHFDQRCDNLRYINALEEILEYYISCNLLQKSIKYAMILMNLHWEAGRTDKYCLTSNLLGKIYSLLPDMDKSEYFLQQALAESRKSGNKKMESFSLTNMGLLLRKQNKLDKSLESYFLAKGIMEELIEENPEKIDYKLQSNYLQVLDQIGVLYNILKQPQRALKYMELSLEKALAAQIIPSIYSALINLGVYYSEIDTDQALSYYEKAIPYIEKHGNQQILAVVMSNIGSVYEDKELFKNALGYFIKSLEMLNKLEQGDYKLFVTRNIGNIYYKLGDYDKALQYAEMSLNLAQKDRHNAEMIENYQLISNIYRAEHEYSKALEYADKYIALKEKDLNMEIQNRVKVLQKKFEDASTKLKITQKKNSLISNALKKKMNLDFIGCSPAIKRVHELAQQAANTPNSNVLITGESGTGKEIIANLIHFASSRQANMFIAVNSGSVPEHLMESAFWGHKRGAFTGAVREQIGYLKMADKGTLFLDELGDMPIIMQSKLLRVLENKKFIPLGAEKEIESDFRLITATNKNIENLIKNNKFRVDLFYRINTIEIHIPPLRDRVVDIKPIAEYYLDYYARNLNKSAPQLGNDAMEYLENYSFPGNVRELKNMMERIMITLNGDTVHLDDFCDKSNNHCIMKKNTRKDFRTLEDMEKNLIMDTLNKTDNNISMAARKLGIHYTTLNRKIKRYRLNILH